MHDVSADDDETDGHDQAIDISKLVNQMIMLAPFLVEVITMMHLFWVKDFVLFRNKV